jgi:hypothetical protein
MSEEMHEQFAQGDLLIEQVPDMPHSGALLCSANGVTVLAEGETTGHQHAIYGCITMSRDDTLARDIPRDLYVGAHQG